MNECLIKYRKQNIPVIDPRREYQEIKEDIQKAFNHVMDKAWYILGEEVLSFENEFANFTNTKYAIGVASGFDALTLSMDAWGINQDDEIIMSANSFIATALAAIRLGAKPILVDIGNNSFNLDLKEIENKITKRTKAILPTHMHGISCDLDSINLIAKQYNLRVLDDCSHAHGSSYKNQNLGGLCDASAFSLYPIKNLGAYGDAGIVTTNDEILAKKIKELRNYGSKTKNEHSSLGYNSRLDELQAAFLRVKLAKLPEWNSRRTKLAEIYFNELESIPQIKILKFDQNINSNYYSFPILVPENRDKLKVALEELGIGSSILYPKPIHLHQALSILPYKPGDFPKSEKAANEVLSLPISPHHQKDEIYTICTSIKSFFSKQG